VLCNDEIKRQAFCRVYMQRLCQDAIAWRVTLISRGEKPA